MITLIRKSLSSDTFLTEYVTKFNSFSFNYYKYELDLKTINLINYHVKEFEKFIYYSNPNYKSISDISEDDLNSFKYFCFNELKNSPKTVNKKITSLNYFFKFLFKEMNLIPYNYCLNITRLKTEECKKAIIFNNSELKIIFSNLREFKYGLRDIVISKLLLTTGLEIQEILNLTIKNVDLENKNIIINNTSFYILDMLYSDLFNYLLLRKELLKPNLNSNYLFLSQRGTQYSIRSYEKKFKEAIIKSNNIDLNLSPRNLRSTFLYQLAKIISDENELKFISRQKSLDKYLKQTPLKDLI